METKVSFKAKGYVLGNYWGGGQGAYPTITINADTEDEVIQKANDSLDNGSLDSGMGYESLIGAILDITKITIIVVDGKEFVNKEFSMTTIGELNDVQYEYLENCLLY